MTEPTKDAIVVFLAVAGVLVACALVGPARAAGDDFPERELFTRRQRGAAPLAGDPSASAILDQALPLRADGSPVPTPFSPSFVLEVTPSGNVVLPGEPYMLIVAGKCPIELVPPRCREDFKRLPAGASLACMRNDEIHQRLRPGYPL